MAQKKQTTGKPGRPKGYPKTGGRKAGTGNKATAELKSLLSKISYDYLTAPKDGPEEVPSFARDVQAMSPVDRAQVHIKLLRHNVPIQTESTLDLNLSADDIPADELLRQLFAPPSDR